MPATTTPKQLILLFLAAIAGMRTAAQDQATAATPAPAPRYRNVFLEAGSLTAVIDAKVDKAWRDLFEGPDKVYFAVGDSMGYVTDLKNHDARTEGLSYGMMIAVQLDKKEVFDRIWR